MERCCCNSAQAARCTVHMIFWKYRWFCAEVLHLLNHCKNGKNQLDEMVWIKRMGFSTQNHAGLMESDGIPVPVISNYEIYDGLKQSSAVDPNHLSLNNLIKRSAGAMHAPPLQRGLRTCQDTRGILGGSNAFQVNFSTNPSPPLPAWWKPIQACFEWWQIQMH